MHIAIPLYPPTPHIPPYQGAEGQACALQNLASVNRMTGAILLMQLRRSRYGRLHRLRVVR